MHLLGCSWEPKLHHQDEQEKGKNKTVFSARKSLIFDECQSKSAKVLAFYDDGIFKMIQITHPTD